MNKAAVIAWRVLLGAFAALIVSLSALEAWRSVTDFPQYYAAAKMLFAGNGSQVYTESEIAPLEHSYFPAMNRKQVYFCFPPYSLLLFSPLGLLSPQNAHYLWTGLSIVAFFAALMVLKRTYALSLNQTLWTACLLPLTGPYCQSIIMGQPSFFMLLGWVFSLWALKVKNNPSLAILGFCALLPKPHLLLPLLAYLAGAGRYRIIIGFFLVAIALFLASLIVPGLDSYVHYLEFSKFANQNPEIMHLDGCVTVRSQLLRFFPDSYGLITSVSVVLFLLGLAFLFWLGRRFKSHPQWLNVCALCVFPLGFVTSIYVHPYDLLLFLPSIFVFAYELKDVRIPRTIWPLSLIYLALFIFPVYIQLYFTKTPFFPLFWAVLAWTALMVWNALRISGRFDEGVGEV